VSIKLTDLPYAINALEPHISKETLEYHYGKHHKTYVDNLNKLLPGTKFEHKSLEEIVLNATEIMFNNAGQIYNHNFYWNSLSPNGGGIPDDELLQIINVNFGSFDKFKEEFSLAATSLFGSGWTWLVKNNLGKLSIINTTNSNTPVREGKIPLLTCDVWEHAYYIDYRNMRSKYIAAFWNLVNWRFVQKNLLLV